ncbi:type II secretory pathway protein [Aliidiomarina celeris]|uniref:type II secretory pathway protein n=1 Tax=Aliidiomarina celeris TaxID=2249428 RepID=UPI000DEA6946|nr:type II secretory pathway protein [Aliidiomarina celeris]
MFPNRNAAQQHSFAKQQRGSALVIAVFIIVVMSIIGIAMVRILNDSSRATVSDVYGARAYAAARSGAEAFLTELFPLNGSTNSALCEPRAAALPINTVFTGTYNQPGLVNCSATVYCDRLELSSPFSGTHFRIITEGTCSAGTMNYSKQIILEASDGIF